MNIKGEIRSHIAFKNKSLKELVELINARFNKAETVANLSNKLSRGTIKYREAKEIAEVLDYEIKWTPTNRTLLQPTTVIPTAL